MTTLPILGSLPRVRHRGLQRMVVAAVALLGAASALGLAGARINTSRSIAVGLYWTSERPVAKGSYVLLCPPDSPLIAAARHRGYIGAGPCPGGLGYMMKRVLAVGGDIVASGADGVRVNGVLLPFSVPLAVDRAGRPLPRWRADDHTLDSYEVLPMSDVSATSFDGRYFGPVDRAQVRSVIVPVLTW